MSEKELTKPKTFGIIKTVSYKMDTTFDKNGNRNAMESNLLHCPRCGMLRVVTYLRSTRLHAVCSQCQTTESIFFPESDIHKLIEIFSEQIYRCVHCGKPIPNFTSSQYKGGWVVLSLICLEPTCPGHRGVLNKRYIIKKIYPFLQEYRSKTNPNIVSPPLQPNFPSIPLYVMIALLCIGASFILGSYMLPTGDQLEMIFGGIGFIIAGLFFFIIGILLKNSSKKNL